jgi:O-antigen/teichoic acid export membrane protein
MKTNPVANIPILHWRVLINTISNYAGKIISLGIWLFLTPFILRRLGANQYGIWVLIGSLVTYGSLFDLGIAGAITKYVAENIARENYSRAKELIATALWLYSVIGLIAVVVGAGFAPFFLAIFKIPSNEVNETFLALIFSAIGLGISFPASVTTAVLRGLQRFDLLNWISIVGTLINTLAIVLVLALGWGILGIIAINIPLTVIMQIPAVWMIHRAAPKLQFGFQGANRSDVRKVFGFSSVLFLINLSSLLQQKTDEIVVGTFLPTSSITPYSIAHRLSDLPQILTDQFLKVIMPLASQLSVDQYRSKLQNLLIISTRLTLALFLPVGIAIMIMAKPFIRAWVGEDYAGYSYLVTLLTLAGLVNTILWPAGSILQGIERHRILGYAALGSGVMNLLISLMLVRSLGLTGVALGTLIPAILETMIVLPYTWFALNVDWRTALKNIFLITLIPAIPQTVSLFLLRELFHPASLFGVAMVIGVGVFIYLGIYFLLGSNLEERKFSLSLLGSSWRLLQRYLHPSNQ